MKRAADYEPEALSRFFGDDPGSPEWHRRYTRARRQGGHTSHALLRHYRERLSGIGYVWFDDRVIVEVGNNGTPLYHMLFASKHQRGEDLWGKSAVKKCNGQLRMDLYLAKVTSLEEQSSTAIHALTARFDSLGRVAYTPGGHGE
jgi:hypothetical protein